MSLFICLRRFSTNQFFDKYRHSVCGKFWKTSHIYTPEGTKVKGNFDKSFFFNLDSMSDLNLKASIFWRYSVGSFSGYVFWIEWNLAWKLPTLKKNLELKEWCLAFAYDLVLLNYYILYIYAVHLSRRSWICPCRSSASHSYSMHEPIFGLANHATCTPPFLKKTVF